MNYNVCCPKSKRHAYHSVRNVGEKQIIKCTCGCRDTQENAVEEINRVTVEKRIHDRYQEKQKNAE